jgi:ribosomal protein L37E
MSVREKAFWANLIFVLGFVVAVIAFISIDRRLAFLWPIFGIGVMIYMLLLRCPRCGQWIYKRQTKILGLEFTYYGGNPVPRRCARCGQDLSQTVTDKNPAVAT